MKTTQIKPLYWLILLAGIASFSSCLKSDLPKMPLWDTNGIDHIYVEYRYNTDELYYEEPIVGYQRLVTSNVIVDSSSGTIAFTVTVPAATGKFTAEKRAEVNLNHLWVYMDIPTGATIAAVAPTPALGYATDLTQPQTYEVTAANGETRKWTIKVTEFLK